MTPLRTYLLRVYTILGVVAVVITLLIVAFAGDFFHETLELPWRSIGVFVMLFVVVATVAVLWRKTLRDWARRPDKSAGRKTEKQRS